MCEYKKDNFCTAFLCYSKESCTAKNKDGKPLYSNYESTDHIKRDKEQKKEMT